MTSARSTPRWELRGFGEHFPAIARHLNADEIPVTHTIETYILSSSDDVNVKIRQGELDVKRRLRVEAGLELWSPVLKTSFPIDAGVVVSVFAQWNLPVPALLRERYSPAEFLQDVVSRSAQLHPMVVLKARRQTTIEGCTVELASLEVKGHTYVSAAIESKDPDEVHRLARTLGLAGHENVSYVVGLRRRLYADPGTARADGPDSARRSI